MPLAPYRTGGNFALFLALFFVVWALRATVGFHVDEQLPEGGARQVYSLISKILLWLVPAVLYALAIRSDRPAQSLRLGWPDFSLRGWRTVLIGLAALAAVAWGAAHAHDATSAQLGTALLARGLGTAAWAFPSAFVEEAFFRGLVQTELTERLRFAMANVVTSLLFVAIHLPHWLWMHGFDSGLWRMSAGVFFVGLVTGYLTRRTGSIWPAAAWHTANNTLTGVW
jgi:membrane protease YdiL (CAAX protease family)